MGELKDFPHPLDTPLISEEEIDVMVPVVDKDSKQPTYEKRKQKVYFETTYHAPKAQTLSCEKGKHEFYLKDPTKYVASCHNCMKNRFISPIHNTLKDGHIIERSTGRILE